MEYTDENRGRIQYEERFKQPLLFEGMTFNKVCPTDIDAFTEYHDRFFIIFEVKRNDAQLSYGQKTALVRIVDAIQESGRNAVLYICRHNIGDCSKPVFLKNTIISEAYYCKQWYIIKPKTALEVWNYAMQWARDNL